MKKQFYKGGAPKKAIEEKRDRFVQVRFTGDEYSRMEQRKAKTKTKDMSTFIRSVCLEKPLLMKTQMETYQDIALSLLREMRSDLLRVGVNINQSSRRINSTTDYHDLQRDVNQMSANLSLLEAQLRHLMMTISGPSVLVDPTSHDHQN